MATETLQQISELLSAVGAPGTFSAKCSRPTDDLHLKVKGVGPLRFPVPHRQAKQLCQIARPARYGQGEQTLLDRGVRDTWEIPKSRVKIDMRRWKQTLLPVLEQLRSELGVSAEGQLKVELHSMLVYAPGQFFLPHQDSEKSDEMVGTLVVTLPSSFKGGAMVVEHQEESATYRGSKKYLSFVAFYADCRHEVRPVKEGYRIALTYNLMLKGDDVSTSPNPGTPSVTVDALVDSLHEHFETPLPPRRYWKENEPPREPPRRLVYLLDHQYTERGLSWQRLKGNDAARSAALRTAAERYGCELVLALAEVHECWQCMEEGWHKPRYGYHRSWRRDEDETWYDEDPQLDGPDAYELIDLVDSGITLTRWIDDSGAQATPLITHVNDDEVCSTTPSSALEAYASEYEGYMGNYGNTMDRWYRRAAIVLWPHQHTFAVRAEAAPAWALDVLKKRLKSSPLSEVQALTTSLMPFWDTVAPHEEQRGFFEKALLVAEGLEDSTLATSLLQPFQVESLTRGRASVFVALVKRYGESWARSLLSGWTSSGRLFHKTKDSLAWLGSLPRLCEALCAIDTFGKRCAKLLLQNRWGWLKEMIEVKLDISPPSIRDKAVATLAKPILGILESAELIGEKTLRNDAVSFFCAQKNEPLLPCLVQVLRVAARKKAPKKRASPGLDAVRQHCIRRLEARRALPVRDENDWSIDLPEDCRCELCATLSAFLSDPKQQQLEWSIAKEKRQHIHRRIDAHELPVHHTTRRSGSPYTLVLSKTKDLFKREAEKRRSWQSDLDRLTEAHRSR